MRVGESAKRAPLDVGTTFGDLVGKLDGARGREGARDRKKAKTGKREGRKPYTEANPVTVQLAKELREGDRYPSDECRRPDRGANTRGGLRSALRGSPSQPRPPSPLLRTAAVPRLRAQQDTRSPHASAVARRSSRAR